MGRAGFNSTKYKIRAQEEGAQTQTGFIGRTRTMPFIYYTSEFFA